MIDVVGALADLSALRNRDQLDIDLVSLVMRLCGQQQCAIRLACVVGEEENARWLTCCRQDSREQLPVRDTVGVDLTALPLLSSVGYWQHALSTGQINEVGIGPYATVLPYGSTAQGTVGVLELLTPRRLARKTLHSVAGILKIYQNLQGLLDYGEKDTLTELLNRKTFDDAFFKAAIELNRNERTVGLDRRGSGVSDSYWLAVIDIDYFKRVNDNFGHLIGDEVLLLMARLMRINFRIQDRLYRFGGEEFVVLMRCHQPSDAAQAMARFREQVEAHSFPQVGTITVSIGFSRVRLDDTPSNAFDRADKAVYYAKGHGRNQVCEFDALVRDGKLTELADDIKEVDFF